MKILTLILTSLLSFLSPIYALNSESELEAAVHGERGSKLLLEKKYEAAIEDCTKAINLDPKQSIYFSLRSMAYGELAKFQQSLEDINQAIALDPNDARSYSIRAVANQQLGNHSAVVNDLIIASRLGDAFSQEQLKGRGISWEVKQSSSKAIGNTAIPGYEAATNTQEFQAKAVPNFVDEKSNN